nr:MAG TPA: CopG-like protein [Caudoviricetes sp.]
MTQDTRKRFTFRLPENLYQKLKDKADEQGFSINALMLHVLQEWLKDQMK